MELPASTVVALTVKVGGGSIVKDTAVEVPPPGAGDCTVTCVVPLDATSLAATDARSCVALTKVVGFSAPFQRIIDEAMKPPPFTTSVNAGAPAVT